MPDIIDISTIPAKVTIKNITTQPQVFHFYDRVQYIQIAPSDELVIRVDSSKELSAYIKFNLEDVFEVTWEKMSGGIDPNDGTISLDDYVLKTTFNTFKEQIETLLSQDGYNILFTPVK